MKQAIQPLTDAWQRLPIEPRRSTLLGIRFRSPQVGLYHMDRTRRPKPLTYQVAFEPETVQEKREEGNEAVEEAGQA